MRVPALKLGKGEQVRKDEMRISSILFFAYFILFKRERRRAEAIPLQGRAGLPMIPITVLLLRIFTVKILTRKIV